MQPRVEWTLRERFYNPTPEDKQKIEEEIYNTYFGPNHTHRFYHFIVFKLNLHVFEKDEYKMLSRLANLQHIFRNSPLYHISTEDITSRLNALARNMAWKMAQHNRLGKHSQASKIPQDAAELIAQYAGIQ
eukprot:2308583-Rhodomonas_salina.1